MSNPTLIRITAFILTFACIATTVYATPQEQYQANLDQQTSIQQQIQQNNELIDAIESEKTSLQEDLETLQAKISIFQTQVDTLDEQILAIEEELDGRYQELDDKYHIYHMQIRRAEEFGSTSYWSLIFESTSLADLLTRLDYIEEVMAYQKKAIAELETTVEELDAQSDILSSLRADRSFASSQLKFSQNQLYNAIETRIAEINKLENLNDAHKQELDALAKAGSELLQRINGSDYKGSTNPAYLYQRYVVETGEAQKTPLGAEIVAATLPYVGGEYVWGGSTPSEGFDCSGMTYYVYGQFGYGLYRTAATQFAYSGKHVEFQDLQAGDLVFFHPPEETYISHVGMYIGDGIFIHAANRNKGIIISSLYSKYYSTNYAGAKRII